MFCTRKTKRVKLNKCNYLTFRSVNNFSTPIFKEALRNLTFADYEKFICVNETYSDLTSKIFNVVNKVAPAKTIRVKNNTNEWLDAEITEKIAARDKLFKKFQKSKLSVEEILYKEARNAVQALIKDKKLLQDKLSENIINPKELWKIIEKLVYQIKRLPQQAYASIRKKS